MNHEISQKAVDSSQRESHETSKEHFSAEAWNPRACVYTDEPNNITAGFKDSSNTATWERLTTERTVSGSQNQNANFLGGDGKHYKVTEFDSDLIVKHETILELKQLDSSGRFVDVKDPVQVKNAMEDYEKFRKELDDGVLCRELFPEEKSPYKFRIQESFGSRRPDGSLLKLPNGDTIEETPGTRFTRSADGLKVTVQAVEAGRIKGQAEYRLLRDKDGDETCILDVRFPDGYKQQSELSAEDFYAIRDSKEQTWKWLGDPKNHKFYIQGAK